MDVNVTEKSLKQQNPERNNPCKPGWRHQAPQELRIKALSMEIRSGLSYEQTALLN